MGHFIMLKGSVHQEDITVKNVCAETRNDRNKRKIYITS